MQTTGIKGFNLSRQQVRLRSFQDKNTSYRTQCTLRIDGDLNIYMLLKAFQVVLARHTILRTTFRSVAGMDTPLQIVLDAVQEKCVVVDLQGMAALEHVAQLNASIRFLQTVPFDLEVAPLCHSSLFCLSATTHLLHLSLPALCIDDTSLTRYVTELMQAYTMELGYDGELSEEPLQYVDVIAWQEELLTTKGPAQHLWEQIDTSALAALHTSLSPQELTQGELQTQIRSFHPQLVEVPCKESVWDDLQLLAEQHNVSPAALLLTCWHIVLRYITHQKHIIIGVAGNGRIDQELTDILGLYTRFVPAQTHFPLAFPYIQAVAIVDTLLENLMDEQLYFTWEALQQPTVPFFMLSFEYVTWPDAFKAGNISSTLENSASCIEPFLLKLRACQIGKRLQLSLYYDANSKISEQIQSFAAMLSTVIENALTQPDSAIGQLPLLTPAAYAQLLPDHHGPENTLPPLVFHQLFEQQVALRPGQLAVISETEQLTYQELNARANQLAHVLRDTYGIGPDIPVGLCVTRSTAMLIGLLGILKAGGIYIPIDPQTPATRITHQLQHPHLSLLLTQEELILRLPPWGGQIISFEHLSQELASTRNHNLTPINKPQDIAYIIYTSGSTGQPKGVMINQESTVNYAVALCKRLDIEPGWSYATVSTLAADLGNTAIFCALISGGCLHILDYETISSHEAFAHWITRHPIDVLKIVPSHLSALLTGEQAGALLPRKALILGGEALPTTLVEYVKRLGGTCHIYNHYGPTEATIGVLMHQVTNKSLAAKTIPIGKPLANTEVYVLGPGMQLLPTGVIGEVYIGGKALAVGYLQNSEQTAERFVPHPFSNHAGARLYRTGDLAFLTLEKEIAFVGRNDQQVKLRGYRIELGEIEAVLREHENIWNVVVTLHQNASTGDAKLVAYVVAKNLPYPTDESLREFSAQHLPDYMLPATFVWLEALPLTVNGKVDRAHLPEPALVHYDERITPTLPRNPIEELLAEIWTALLGIHTISISANFFSLGGHSLLATRMIARIRVVLQIEISLRTLFDAPTLAELAQTVELALRKEQDLAPPPLVPVPRTQALPLSFAQQRLWFLNLLEPQSTAYILPRARQFLGHLNVAALEEGLCEMVRRHEILRTTFQEHMGQTVQRIHLASTFLLPVIDLSGLDQMERETEARRLIRLDGRHPFDLTHGPVQRANLLRMKHEEHILLLTMHHIISDAWSNDIYVRELALLYREFVAKRPPPLPPLPIQYADFAVWQRNWLQGAVLEKQLSYWKQQLAAVPPLELPTDHRRPAVQSYRGALVGASLPLNLHTDLMALCQQEGVTLFMLLLTAFQVLLARYSGQTDISIGTPIANRTQSELEGLIGFFVNTLVLRSDLSGNPTFVELLKRVREVALGAYTHQDVPFEQLVGELQPERDLSYHPLFQVMFSVQQMQQSPERLDGITVRSMSAEHSVTKFDITFNVVSSSQGFFCSVEYSTDLFVADTIVQLLSHWHILLEGIISTPQRRIADLPLLATTEQQKLLQDWNAYTHETPPECLHSLFARQVARTPDALAVIAENSSLSFAVLEQRSNQLAYSLRNLGVEAETPVGVALERSPTLLICLLAVCKAGGSYVPLDPAYPRERLHTMIADTQMPMIITSHTLIDIFAKQDHYLLFIEDFWSSRDQFSSTPLPQHAHIDTTAYIIFTSGSTGRPKGVQVTHRGIHNLVQQQMNAFAVQNGSRILQFASLSFDASIWEIVMALLTGGCLCLATPQQVLPGPDLLALLREWAITTLTITPSALASTGYQELPHLTTIIVAGEACSSELVERWAPGRHFWDAYGPTEATICASMAECLPLGQKPTIGRPLANIQLYVLNAYFYPVPLGVPGELYIGGCGLARGYLKHADITAERFIPNPFTQQPGTRLYRTGDRVRYLHDGHLDFLGRVDQQVKIRGYRIELREIEIVLSQHPQVLECVVIVDDDIPADPRLLAYVVADGTDVALAPLDLRRYLQQIVPEYMLPSHIVIIDEMPFTPNGKINKRALASLETYSESIGKRIDAARTPIEELLVNIWCDILGDEQVSIYANFFDLGGHSLLATQIMARVQALLQIELPLHVIFEAPTIAGLAHHIEFALRDTQGHSIPPLVPVERTQALPLSFAQQRLWFLHQLEPESTAYLIPIARRLHGPLHLVSLTHSLNLLIQRHETLRTTFHMQNSQPLQVIHPATPLLWPLIDLSSLPLQKCQAQLQHLRQQETQLPYDLTIGPLLRAALLRINLEEHVLLLTMHHIISDAWSHDVLFHELTTTYRAFVTQNPVVLPPLPIQYADFAIWQRQWLQGEMLDAQLAYWQQQLADIQPLELPLDTLRPALQSFRGAHCSSLLPAPLQEKLIALSRQKDVTLFILLLAAFNVLLYRYTGQKDICIGMPIANRSRPELEGLIGFFINTLVLRTDLSGDPTFLELLTRVRHTTLQAYAHQDIPFEQLVECLQPARDMSRSPLFQVMFSQQQSIRAREGTEKLSFNDLDTDHVTAKFDITFHMMSSVQGLYCSVEYNTDLFETATIKRLLAHWQNLLAGIAAAPQSALSAFPLLDRHELTTLLHEWNATQTTLPEEIKCVQQLFEIQVALTPDALAVSYQDQAITYETLNMRANMLARYLRDQAIGMDRIVAVFMERSPEFLVSILGILKAGAGYLPLDPSTPSERLQFLLEDTCATLLLTLQHHRTTLPNTNNTNNTKSHYANGSQPEPAPFPLLVCMDTEWSHIAAYSGENLPHRAYLDTISYTIYTSGSTGRPKGVLVPHSSLVNHCQAIAHHFMLTPADRVLQFASPGFDVAAEEIFPTLSRGATLVLCPQESIGTFSEFQRFINQEQLTILNLPATYWHKWVLDLAASQKPLPASLRLMVVGSEKVLPERLTMWQHLPTTHIRWCNAYGPTETTITATIHEAGHTSHTQRHTAIPIGKPLANIRTYVLDHSLRPVPVGVAGELYIGGTGVARGYLHNPALTSERFIPDPFATSPGARLYRSGDSVRYLPTGQLVIQGRSDMQVKIRGYRIELGEIAAVLSGCPLIQDCAIQVYEDKAENQHIIAYVVSREPAQVLASEALREYLRPKLPSYMLPSFFIPLPELPLTAHGKIDYRALPEPQHFWNGEQNAIVHPRTAMEELLLEIWSDVLGDIPIGIYDNFFASGGHSLLAAQVISRIRALTQVEVPLWRLFEAQTIAELAPHIERLLRDATALAAPPIQPVSRTQNLPLSFAQQRIWFIDQLETGMTAYLIPSARQIHGPLNAATLERSLEALIQRHESLRTTFAVKYEQPVQIIHPIQSYRLPVVDLSALLVEQATLVAKQLAGQEALHPCDLERGPLFRSALLRVQQDMHVLLITMHHIISDAWSDELFSRELFLFYHAFATGTSAPLPPLPIQYADFALWQRQWLQGAAFEASVAYWRLQLADITPVELPADYPHPPRQTFRGAFEVIHLPASLVTRLTQRCRQTNVTQFMFLLAAFNVLLAHYTNQTDISIGTPMANRSRSEIEGIIGFFVNTLVLRTKLERESTFMEVLRQVRQIALDAYAHQDVPFEQLVEAVQPERNLSHSPLFQIMFGVQQVQPTHQPSLSVTHQQAAVTLNRLENGHTITKFDLTFGIASSIDGLRCGAEYNRDLFDDSTIRNLLRQWALLLEEILEAPETPIMEFSLLTPAERHQLLVEWNDTRTPDEGDEQCLHVLFAAQVAQTPDAIAVIGEDTCFSYASLERLANQLAHSLKAHTIAPETLIGVAIEPSASFVLCMLAILKTGAGYVPLDLSYPLSRLTTMTTDAHVSLIIASQYDPLLAAMETKATIITLNLAWPAMLLQPHEAPYSPVHRDNTAYVIYTSGSTGTPKGVAVTHRGLGNLARVQIQTFAVHTTSRVLQFASLSFDASVSEIAMTIVAGASLTLVPRQWLLPGDDFIALLQERAITVVTLPPSVLTILPTAHLPALATLIAAGEQCSATIVRRWATGRKFFNAYGPTEATVCASIAECADTGQKPLIGKPIANVQLYVLDTRLQPVPVGVSGELYISGIGMARGYLNQPDITAQRFIPHPFSVVNGARLYKTGDRVRYRANKELEYLGRFDQQVKLHGYRIELAEIEAALLERAEIQEAVVLVREDSLEEQRLVAYLVADPQQNSLDINALRMSLQQRLPDYMLPSRIIVLDQFPLTPAKKIDRRALPAPGNRNTADDQENTEDYTLIEKILLNIWQDILEDDRLGIHDDFFESGGHSLLAARLLLRIKELLQISLPLHDLFETPTVAELAIVIEQRHSALIQQAEQADLEQLLLSIETMPSSEM